MMEGGGEVESRLMGTADEAAKASGRVLCRRSSSEREGRRVSSECKAELVCGACFF